MIECLPIIGRAARRKRDYLRTMRAVSIRPAPQTYVDGRGELCAPALHAPIYTFARPEWANDILAPKPYTDADTAAAIRLLELEATQCAS